MRTVRASRSEEGEAQGEEGLGVVVMETGLKSMSPPQKPAML